MPLDKDLLARRFGNAAPGYGKNASIQVRAAESLAERVRTACRLEGLRPARILDIGSGTGFLTSRLSRCFPEALILGIDLAEGMTKEARALHPIPNVRFETSDAEAGLPEGPWDLIASSMAFQWFPDPERVIRDAASKLCPGGMFAAVLPGGETFRELLQAYDNAARDLEVDEWRFPGPGFLTAREWEGLAARYFPGAISAGEKVVVKFPSARAMLESVRSVGANDASGVTGKAALPLLRRALLNYDASKDADGNVEATWDLVTLLARRTG